MNSKRKKAALALAVVAMATLAFTGAAASAAMVATDLNAGGTDTGFDGGWVGSNNVFIVDANDLTYANYAITQTGTTQKVYACNTSHADRMDSRNLAAAMSGEMWFSVLVNVPTGANFAGLAFDSDLTTGGAERYSHALSELRVLLTPSQLIVDLDGGALPSGTGSYAADTTHLILGNMNVGAGNDTLSVWVDPDLTAVSGPGGLPTADFTETTVDFTDSIVRIGVPLSWGGTSPNVDAIRLSDTQTAFEDVTGVPEPATLGLLGLGGLAMLKRRRHA